VREEKRERKIEGEEKTEEIGGRRTRRPELREAVGGRIMDGRD